MKCVLLAEINSFSVRWESAKQLTDQADVIKWLQNVRKMRDMDKKMVTLKSGA